MFWCCAEPATTTSAEVESKAKDSGVADKAAVETEIEITLSKESSGTQAKIGLDIVHWPPKAADSKGLKIKGIKPGLVQAWNDKNPGKLVGVGDIIIACNGTAGSGQEIQDSIAKNTTLVLKIKQGVA